MPTTLAMMKPTRKVSEDESGEGESDGDDRSDMADQEDGGGKKPRGEERGEGFGRFERKGGGGGFRYIFDFETFCWLLREKKRLHFWL